MSTGTTVLNLSGNLEEAGLVVKYAMTSVLKLLVRTLQTPRWSMLIDPLSRATTKGATTVIADRDVMAATMVITIIWEMAMVVVAAITLITITVVAMTHTGADTIRGSVPIVTAATSAMIMEATATTIMGTEAVEVTTTHEEALQLATSSSLEATKTSTVSRWVLPLSAEE